MAAPSVSQSIIDGALGTVPPTAAQVSVVIGVCSLGVPLTIYSFTDPTTLQQTLGTGPAVEVAVQRLQQSGGNVLVVPVTASVAGANGAVTKTGAVGASVVTITGTPVDQFDVVVTIVVGAALPTSGAATFTYSLDGGRTVSGVISLPVAGTYAIPGTGLTLNFSAATVGAGDSYAFTSTAPFYSTTDLNAALTPLGQSQYQFGFVHVVGVAATAAASASMAAALDTTLNSWAVNLFRYVFGIVEAAQDTDANLVSAFAAFTSVRVLVHAGFAYMQSAISGRLFKRNGAFAVGARFALIPASEDAAWVGRGPVKGIVAPPNLTSGLIRDEFITPGLDAARFCTLCTIPGVAGYFVTNPNMMAPVGSDYTLAQFRRVMDVACSVARAALVFYQSASILVSKTTGFILETEARAVEAKISGQLGTALLQPQPPLASDVTFAVSRTDNILSSRTMNTQVRVTPVGQAKTIVNNIGFTNPALSPK